MRRLDQYIVEFGLAPSRTKAVELIESSQVEVLNNSGAWQVIVKAAQKFVSLQADQVRLKETSLLKYVSRAGLKLEAALAACELDPKGWRCLDVGSSTGGFADCLLRAGAAEVIGIDVGQNQLHPSLQKNAKLKNFEGVHVCHLQEHSSLQEELSRGFELVVVDVSFISLEAVFPHILRFIHTGGYLLALVKPQFELGAKALNKKGIVQDSSLYEKLAVRVEDQLVNLGMSVRDYFESNLPGRDGNHEFFVFAQRPSLP